MAQDESVIVIRDARQHKGWEIIGVERWKAGVCRLHRRPSRFSPELEMVYCKDELLPDGAKLLIDAGVPLEMIDQAAIDLAYHGFIKPLVGHAVKKMVQTLMPIVTDEKRFREFCAKHGIEIEQLEQLPIKAPTYQIPIT